jgi:transposase, IS30 family
MARMGRPGLSAALKSELWERWKSGQSLSEIGVALGKHAASIFGVLAHQGGIYRPPRRRAARVLSLAEREEISRGIAAGSSIRNLACVMGRSPATISREVARNGGVPGYRAAAADQRAWQRARRPKACRLAMHGRLRRAVAAKLMQDWSPEQIAGWLKRQYPADVSMRVSHETIYRSLFIQGRGVLKKELIRHLRRRKALRRSKHASTAGQPRGRIVDAVSIRERPAEVEDRAIPGHWEGDLFTGSRNTHIATLVERGSRFTVLVKLPGKDTESVIAGLTRQVRRLPQTLIRSLTWDRGSEMAQHQRFTVATDVKVYFCDPQSPWQRGTNENTNGLLRQYFPKGADLSRYSQADLNRIALRLNQRPRKTLHYQTPAAKLYEAVASTG